MKLSIGLLVAISVASFCGAFVIAWAFDSKLAVFLAVLLVTVGRVLPLGLITHRREQ